MAVRGESRGGRTLGEVLGEIRTVTCAAGAPEVAETVARSLLEICAPGAEVKQLPPGETGSLPPRIHVSSPQREPAGDVASWMSLRLTPGGAWELSASHAHWLYALSTIVREEWRDDEAGSCAAGRTIHPSFHWLRNLSDFLVGSLRRSRGFSAEEYVRQIARQGFTHVTVNVLGTDRPFESGPPGDVYSWFYDYSPDIDQFVTSPLLKGFYPEEYLRANLAALRSRAACARAYGLVPGLHINSPRSMPEAFWERYPFLRGARVDHPRESFRPRYTLAMAHPAVQEHYRELLRNILREVPDLGFIHIWTNDSGAGFEFVTSLYAGRNGGPYLIREWKSDDEIARAAAGNVLTYYRILREEGKRVNPHLRVICDLAPFYAERKYIVPSLGGGIDAGEFGSFAGGTSAAEQAVLDSVGAVTHRRVDLGDSNTIGVPFPWLVDERLRKALSSGTGALLASPVPASLAPFDINGEVVRAAQCLPGLSLDELLMRRARRWAGQENAEKLLEAWRNSDRAVRAFPPGVPLATFAYPWFRLSVRPFVPDIGAIPERERAYYESYLLATFNNPARVDLNNDMMWNFLGVEEAREKARVIDAGVLPPLGGAIRSAEAPLAGLPQGDPARAVFADLRDRLRAWRSYAETLRNMCGWTSGVHGYIAEPTPAGREEKKRECASMVARELENARSLLALWRESRVPFMPVDLAGETLHSYGENFGELLEQKIRLMEIHGNDAPFIDAAFMWRMPGESH